MPTTISSMGSHPFQKVREQGANPEHRDDDPHVNRIDHVCPLSFAEWSAIRKVNWNVLPVPSLLSTPTVPP